MLAVFKSAESKGIELRNIHEPEVIDGHVLVKIEACGICGTDLGIYRWKSQFRWINVPRLLGHELCGVVVKSSSDKFKVGERVVSETGGVCMECNNCLKGKFNICENQQRLGQHIDGGMAEYANIPERLLFKVPDTMSSRVAILTEPLAVGIHAFERCSFKPGDSVAVIGPGSIGILAGMIAKLSGASRVYVFGMERHKKRLRFAEKLGLVPVIWNEETNRVTADIVFDCAGGEGSVDQAVKIANPGGEAIIVGVNHIEQVDFMPALMKEVSIITSLRRNPQTWERAINFLDRYQDEFKDLPDLILPLNEAEKAFELLDVGEHIKIVLEP
jgi:L-iditol 2-dehydrogenase